MAARREAVPTGSGGFILRNGLSLLTCGAKPHPFNWSTPVAGERPAHIKPPSHLSKSPPIPAPAPPRKDEEHGGPKGQEPTRYGDWENKGICWDF